VAQGGREPREVLGPNTGGFDSWLREKRVSSLLMKEKGKGLTWLRGKRVSSLLSQGRKRTGLSTDR
jgi:hypothetical protein